MPVARIDFKRAVEARGLNVAVAGTHVDGAFQPVDRDVAVARVDADVARNRLRVHVAVTRVDVEVEVRWHANVDAHRTVAAAEEREIEMGHLDADGDVVAVLVFVYANIAGANLEAFGGDASFDLAGVA